MQTRAMQVLLEAAELQGKKAQDYQNAASTVKQADYYLNGVQTIYDTMHGKMLRIKSIQETILNDPTFKPNHESLRDSVVDLINYASFYAAYLEGGVPGQGPGRDIFNREITKTAPQVVEQTEPKEVYVYRARKETHP
jgi:hypothetical protein